MYCRAVEVDVSCLSSIRMLFRPNERSVHTHVASSFLALINLLLIHRKTDIYFWRLHFAQTHTTHTSTHDATAHPDTQHG